MAAVSVRVSDRIALWVESALIKHAPGEKALFDVGCFPVADQAGQPVGVGHVVAVSMRGVVVGTYDSLAAQLSNAHVLDEPTVADLVRQMVEQLKAKRSADLAQANGTRQGGPR